jgi:hypothetical protein
MESEIKYFKAFIRVVKSLSNERSGDGFFGSSLFGAENIVEERFIESKDKKGVLDFLLNKYPQFFPNNKIYTRETKDQAQFFYVVVFELYSYEVLEHKESWKCSHCQQEYDSKYLHRPVIKFYNENLYFCKNDICDVEFKKQYYSQNEIPDDKKYINTDICYIYKITEKGSGKCYIGKTLNAPFFRWWNHLTHSGSPFGIYFRQSNLSNWTFEVLEILEMKTDAEVFETESNYIRLYNSIDNGFNTLISKKK